MQGTDAGFAGPQAHPFWRKMNASNDGRPPLPKLRLPRETAFEAWVERCGLLEPGRGTADKVSAQSCCCRS